MADLKTDVDALTAGVATLASDTSAALVKVQAALDALKAGQTDPVVLAQLETASAGVATVDKAVNDFVATLPVPAPVPAPAPSGVPVP